ncbi:MAG TPA: ankyrin repeat domain-containing protein, partial [Leptospiraceae bacterium]|nr:ankyrin repeat domain-containing protein [Leptospiraceae bacterium]
MKKLLFNILLILNIIFINCVSVEERTNQLNHAARYGQKDQVDQLIKDGAVLSKDTLNSAIISGNIEVVKFLLSKGLDINGSDRNKMDSLTYSFESPKSQKEEMFKFLLAEGAKMENPYNILYLGLRDMITPAVTAAIESGAYV